MAGALPYLYGAIASVAVTELTKPKEKDDKPPQIESPTVMPTADAEMVARERRAAIIRQQQRGGRDSTILTDVKKQRAGSSGDSQTLGGNAE